jgi:exopolyphosphatase/guanosine-5'-triphosphate,3'-diphosphate pyrophosphatase
MTAPASQSPGAELAAALDLGSNSFHMIVGRLAGGELHVVDRLREPVRLAQGLDAGQNITPEARDRALRCLERFGQRVAGMPRDRVRAVGTNTLRKAKNSRAFMEDARRALGYRIDIISGREEARLIYLGMAQSTPSEGGKRLVVDIGGGSTEVIVGDGFDIVEADSLFMGCVSFSEHFFPGGELTPKGFRDAQIAAELELEPIAKAYRRIGWERSIGCSGSVHAVHRLVMANGFSDGGITPKSLKKLRKALIAAGHVDRLELPGLTPERAPVIAGGAAILEAIFVELRIERMLPSPGALREGVLYDLVGRIQHEDVRDRTIRGLMERYQVDVDHAARVEETALSMLPDAVQVWQIDEPWAKQLVAWAARLHEIGLAISHTGYHKHAAYLVANGYLAGFSHDEQRVLAAMVGGHRRRLHRELFDGIEATRVDDVIRLCVLFRLAVCLNRGRDATPPAVKLQVKHQRLKLSFSDGWLDEHPLTARALEEERDYLTGWNFELALASS